MSTEPHTNGDMGEPKWIEETRTTHYYRFYGRTLAGYGPSMDPHRCGNTSEPCWVVTETRQCTPWVTAMWPGPTPDGGASS